MTISVPVQTLITAYKQITNFVIIAILALLVFAGQISAGPNSNTILSLDLVPNGEAGNWIDDGITSGNVSGRGTKIAVEVFATGVTTSLVGVKIEFDFDGSVLKDVSVLANLTNLETLSLDNNRITDLSPLVANTGLDSGDLVDVRNNPAIFYIHTVLIIAGLMN